MSDIDLNFDDLRKKINNELAANIGNFCYRVLNFLNKNFNGEIKEIDENKPLIDEINSKAKDIGKNYHELSFNEAVKDILHVSSLGNKYFQDNEPWKAINEDKEKVHKILASCVNLIKNLSILIAPILPDFSLNLQKQLNVQNLRWHDINFDLKNHKINKEEILIKKIEEQDKKQDFPLNLKVARIIESKEHPNADKLYVLQIDLGNEKRQLVAGLRQHYTIEQLKNKKIIVISNLKYAKLRGIESQGMLLAGDDGNKLGLLTVDKSEPGDKVYPKGLENSAKELGFEDFLKLTIIVKNGHAYFENKELKTDKETVSVERVEDGARVR